MPTSWTTSPRRDVQRYPHEEDFNVYSSPSSSELSSDDEDGAKHVKRVPVTRGRPIHRWTARGKATDQKVDRVRNPMARRAYQDFVASPYNLQSMRSYYQRRPTNGRLSSPRLAESGEVYVTTVDEDDQQMFIALFYWRRKVIETHFSAWKWVVFALRRSAKQIHRHTRPTKPLPTGYDSAGLPPPRRNLILKRHTSLSNAEESENNRNSNSTTADCKSTRMAMLPPDAIGEQNLQKWYSSPNAKLLVAPNSNEKRRQFRTELRSIYACFRQWKCSVDHSRKKRVHQLVQATNFHRQKQLKTFIRAWKCGSDIYKRKRKQREDADQFYGSIIKPQAFLAWKRHCRVEREIVRRREASAARLRQHVFHHWHRCILQTRKCYQLAAKICRKHMHLVLRSFQDGIRYATRERLKCADAVAHYQSKLQVSVLRLWRDIIFDDPFYLLSIDHEKRISLSSGVRKWRRYLTRREVRARQGLLADFFRYRICLRHAIQGWGQFVEWTRQRKVVIDLARRHYELNAKKNCVQALQSAAIVAQTRRDQVNASIRWHRWKLATRVLKVWTVNTQKRVRLKTFRLSVNARILGRILRNWRKRTAESQRLLSIQIHVSERWNALLQQTCMVKWVRWLHIESMVASFELKRRNVRATNHFRAWYNWCRIKVSRRNAVVQQRSRSEATHLQRVVSKWYGITLRKRCFNRLVKLFRKKQSRRSVKSVFQLWRVHAHVCRATRKLDRELIRLSLLGWKRTCRELKEHRNIMRAATQYYCERRYAMAVGRWSSFAHRRARSRKLDSKALSHYFRRILIGALQNWYVATRELRRQAELFRYRQHLRDKKIMTNCLHAWYSVVRQRADHRAREWAALQFQWQSQQRRSFYAWFQFLETRRASNERKYVAITAHDNFLQVNVLRAWYMETRRSNQLKLGSSSLRNTLIQRHLQARVTQWSEFCCERQRRRQQLATADKFYSEYLLCLMMFHWQQLWFKRSALRHKEQRAISHINSRGLSKAVALWYENCRCSSNSRSKKVKALRLYSRVLLTRYLRVWKDYNAAVRHKLSKRRFETRRRQQNLLSRMFQRWHSVTQVIIFEKRQFKLALEHRSRIVLGLVFQNWRSYRNKRTLYIIAYTFRRKLLLRIVWISWRQQCEYVTKVRRNILVTRQLLRNNLYRATFIQWKANVLQHRKLQVQLCRADDYHVRYLCKRAVGRLRKQAKSRQAVVRAATVGRINGVRYMWRQWKQFVGIKHLQRCRRSLAKQRYIQNHQSRHLLAWKSHAQRCVRALQNKSDALYRVSCFRMIWSRWCRVVGWRRSIRTMGYRRLEYLQAAMLRRWYDHTKERIAERVKVATAVGFRETKLRDKTWTAWQRYLTHCHEKEKQLVWILSYYSIEVLLRKSFTSWKRLVAVENEKRENRELADAFNLHRIARNWLRTWKAYTALRKVKLIRRDTQVHKSEMLVLSRSIRKWRQVAVVWGRAHHNEIEAAQYFGRRRLMYGLDKLLLWRDVQKNTRERIIRAEHFRANKAMTKCFRRWQHYHQWRAKYVHLTRAFKRNQKEESFMRWKAYWQKRLSMSEKRLQARVFHSVHVEQSAWSAWKTFARAQKQNKTARTFNTTTVLRKTFNLWNRNVHVLRRMRTMFLYQEHFRAQTQFDAWKRYVSARRQLNERLRKAMKFRDNLVKLDVWQKWCAWVATQRQEHATIKLAVVFRQRFSSRKSFSLWKRRCQYWKRKRYHLNQAQLHYNSSILRRCFHGLVCRRQLRLQLIQLQAQVRTQLVETRKRRVIVTLRALSAESHRTRDLIKRAYSHWQLCHQQKYWGRVMQWFGIAKYRKFQRAQADAFARAHLLWRCISALRHHINRMNQLKMKIEAFRCRYFRSLSDECFYQWKAFSAFKQKLRTVRQQTLQSQRRRRLHQWRGITVEQARRRTGMQLMAVKRRHRDLVAWFSHWESVCTDLWLNQELVAHHQRHAHKQRLLRSAVAALRAQLPVRSQRLKCRSFFLQHHSAFLVQVLQRWRAACDHQKATSTCDV